MYRNEEALAAWHYEESCHNLSGKSAELGASLKWLVHTAWGTNQRNWIICQHLQGYGFIGIREICWDSSWDWSLDMYVYRLLRRDGCWKARCRVTPYASRDAYCRSPDQAEVENEVKANARCLQFKSSWSSLET